MKNILFITIVAILLSGCVTRKVPVMIEARTVASISEMGVHKLNCEMIDTQTLMDLHPNNVTPTLKNKTFESGGNRYRIATVLDERKGRPSSVVAEIYHCPISFQTKPAGVVKLLPGAHEVKPVSFAEIENVNCKVVGSHVVEETSPDSVYTELSNEVFMSGGNRYHITKIIATDGVNTTSVSADIYRCKHQSVAFE
ncbi:DUF1471 domain-containing protein [Enterovibrio norvegicus]|uniref:hypothetical protein n=1 Tax=Enterovibrio norvegicus TaxID=188144 RepID=UPI00036B9F37|nr:hypothetical protein [Enterovibrio norvegicus]OEE63297.1 DUF1471 domain-containing protein [Enterovibrio norvegicus]